MSKSLVISTNTLRDVVSVDVMTLVMSNNVIVPAFKNSDHFLSL